MYLLINLHKNQRTASQIFYLISETKFLLEIIKLKELFLKTKDEMYMNEIELEFFFTSAQNLKMYTFAYMQQFNISYSI